MTAAPRYQLYPVPAITEEADALTEQDVEEMAELAIGEALGNPLMPGVAKRVLETLAQHGLKVVAA